MIDISKLEVVAEYKPDVRITKVYQVMADAEQVIKTVYKKYTGTHPVITSANDSKHKKGSMHYLDLGRDVRTLHLGLTEEIKQKIFQEIKSALSLLDPHYDVVFETDLFKNGKQIRFEHIHVEYDINKVIK